MWVFAKGIGFLSIVQSDSDPDVMCVRARKREHLDLAFPDDAAREIVETPKGDYRWRAFVDRGVVADLLIDLVLEIDYTTNVKGSVAAHDEPLKRAMMSCWSAMARYQDRQSDAGIVEWPEWEDDEDAPAAADDLANAMRNAVSAIEDNA